MTRSVTSAELPVYNYEAQLSPALMIPSAFSSAANSSGAIWAIVSLASGHASLPPLPMINALFIPLIASNSVMPDSSSE